MNPVEPLNHFDFRRSLGPGYKQGWYTNEFGGRVDNCWISDAGNRRRNMTERYLNLMRHLRNGRSLESLHGSFEVSYHNSGHLSIAYNCNSAPNRPLGGVMAAATVSARDPIFYRWHLHIDQVAQQFYDRMPR